MVIVYEGPSRLDRSKNVVAILTGRSENRGTGPMLQLWILDPEESPLGDRTTICGSCPLQDGRCYVNWGQAPLSVWNKYKRGGYPVSKQISVETRGQKVRLGAAGEPAALPVRVLKALTKEATSWTGYTHAWKRFPSLRRFLMASVETEAEAKEAWTKGWRTFRTTTLDKGAARPSWGVMGSTQDRLEITCPKVFGKQCFDCGACNGSQDNTDRRASIVIPVHGNMAVMSHWK